MFQASFTLEKTIDCQSDVVAPILESDLSKSFINLLSVISQPLSNISSSFSYITLILIPIKMGSFTIITIELIKNLIFFEQLVFKLQLSIFKSGWNN